MSVIVGSEPALAGRSAPQRRARRWLRPAAGAAVAAGVAAVSILWLRAQAPSDTGVAPPQLAAVATIRPSAPAPAERAPASPDSYVLPPAARGAAAVVPATELANYVVAHSMFSSPVARRNLLSSFMTSESGAAGPIAVSTDGAQDPPRDAKSSAQ